MTYILPPRYRPAEELTLGQEVPAPPNTMEHPGSYAVVLHGQEVHELLKAKYGRDGLCLKLVPNGGAGHPADAQWGGTYLGTASLIQNLIALDGLAPRVYDLVNVNGTHAAQVTDWVKEGRDDPRTDELMSAFERLGVTSPKGWDVGAKRDNWRSGLFVDFSGLYLDEDRVNDLVNRLRQRATMKKGKPAGSSYQEVRDLGIPGDRPAERVFPVDPGPTVLDIGCNLGHFSRLAVDQGAVRVVGVDRGETAELCRLVHVLLGYWTIDVVAASLPAEADQLPALGYELAVCLSTIGYMGDEGIPWLASIAPALWLEGHGSIPAEHYLPALERAYETVQRLDDTTDNKVRAQFYCLA